MKDKYYVGHSDLKKFTTKMLHKDPTFKKRYKEVLGLLETGINEKVKPSAQQAALIVEVVQMARDEKQYGVQN